MESLTGERACALHLAFQLRADVVQLPVPGGSQRAPAAGRVQRAPSTAEPPRHSIPFPGVAHAPSHPTAWNACLYAPCVLLLPTILQRGAGGSSRRWVPVRLCQQRLGGLGRVLLPRMSRVAVRQPVSESGSAFGEICTYPHLSQLIALCRAACLLISASLIFLLTPFISPFHPAVGSQLWWHGLASFCRGIGRALIETGTCRNTEGCWDHPPMMLKCSSASG